MKKTQLIAIILILNLIISLAISLFPSQVLAAQKIDNQIEKIDDKKYPGIKDMLQALKKEHPNWNFKVLYTDLNWDNVIKAESKHGRNLVGKNYSKKWVCDTCGYKGYSGKNWVCTSNNAIKYMMDPRNSLNYADIFQFLELSYDESVKYDKKIIKSILKDSFLDDGNLNKYIKTIMSSCKEKNVNPYYIAAKIIQEQGKRGGATFKMKADDLSSEDMQLLENEKVLKVVPNTTVKDINEFLDKKNKIVNYNKEELKEADKVGTGFKLNGEYKIVVLGDTKRDIRVDAKDYMKIKNYIMDEAKLNEEQLIAADVNLDGKIDAKDYMKIKNYIMEETEIKLQKIEYYYNIFNINAGGTTVSSIMKNALSYAKAKEWNTIEKCIEGGVEFIANGYINAGQDTMYFEKFDVIGDSTYSHQYAQDVLYAQNQGEKLKKILEDTKAIENEYTFVIPLYENMPTEKCARP